MRGAVLALGLVLGCRAYPTTFGPGSAFEPHRIPRLSARLVGPRLAIVEGTGFTAATVLVVEIGVDRATDAGSCASALRREIETSRSGRFRVVIAPPDDASCSFACGVHRTPLRAFVSDRLRSPPVACW